MDNKMFCYQCQETAGCKGCTISGVCGKTPEIAKIQDLLIYVTKGLSEVTTVLRGQEETISPEINHHIVVNLFNTITNANFDGEVFYQRVSDPLVIKNDLLTKVRKIWKSHCRNYRLQIRMEVNDESYKVRGL